MGCLSRLFNDQSPFYGYPFLCKWEQFCEWLEQQPEQTVTKEQVMDQAFDPVMKGRQFYMLFVPAAAKQRRAYGLIRPAGGKGWRLHANWRERLAELRALLPVRE